MEEEGIITAGKKNSKKNCLVCLTLKTKYRLESHNSLWGKKGFYKFLYLTPVIQQDSGFGCN